MAMKPHFNTTDMTPEQIDKKMREDFEARNKDLSSRSAGFGACPVVRVVSDEPGHTEGFVEINQSDFNPNKHKLWGGEQPNPLQLATLAKQNSFGAVVGSDTLPDDIEVGSDTPMAKGEILRQAFAASGLTEQLWNAIGDAERTRLMTEVIERITNANIQAKADAAKIKAANVGKRAKPKDNGFS